MSNSSYTCNDYDSATPCPCSVGDPDIAGIGVLVAFMVTTSASILLTLLGTVALGSSDSASFIDRFIVHIIQRVVKFLREKWGDPATSTSRDIQRPESELEEKSSIALHVLHSTLLGLNDQALWLGIALLLVQLLGLGLYSITSHHWTVIGDLCWLLSLTQIFSMDLLSPIVNGKEFGCSWDREHDTSSSFQPIPTLGWFRNVVAETQWFYDHHKRKATIPKRPLLITRAMRASAMLLMFLLLAVSSALGPGLSWNNDGCPALCVIRSSPMDGFTSDPSTLVILFFTYPSYILGFLDIGIRSSIFLWIIRQKILSWTSTKLVKLLAFTTGEHRVAERIAFLLVGATLLISFTYAILQENTLYIAWWPVLQSVYANFLTFILFYIFAVLGMWSDRQAGMEEDSCDANNGENQWTVGQIIPVILMIVPVVSAIQAYSEKKNEEQTSSSKPLLLEERPSSSLSLTQSSVNSQIRNTLEVTHSVPQMGPSERSDMSSTNDNNSKPRPGISLAGSEVTSQSTRVGAASSNNPLARTSDTHHEELKKPVRVTARDHISSLRTPVKRSTFPLSTQASKARNTAQP